MKLSSFFTSHMVFAAQKPIRIFGTGKGFAQIEFCQTTKEINSCSESWEVEFPAMQYGGPYTLTFTTDNESLTLSDIYIGEVYLFNGQSNIAFMLGASNTPKEKYENIDRLRIINVNNLIDSSDIGWRNANKEWIHEASALCYLVGRELTIDKKDIAIGVIQCTQGASVIESWMPEGTLERLGIDIPENEKFLDHYHEEYSAWNKEAFLYNAKLSKIIPYALSGIVWYQGESDASEAEGLVYEKELSELIRIYREKFIDENLPVTVVQLADTHERMALGPGWKLIQDAQERISTHETNVYTVISKDICENDDIHPASKEALAKRIAEVIKKHYFAK